MDARAEALIETLGLAPHPEGGYFREVFRSATTVDPDDGRGRRAALTAIYFLLVAGQFSRWHSVRSDEAWQFCEGDPLELLKFDSAAPRIERIRLGCDTAASARLHVVPAGRWQAARPLGRYTFAACTVGPGFDYADFSFLSDSPLELRRLEDLSPDLVQLAHPSIDHR
jgi:predicted cupin superfamily sugar epimerase